MSRLLKTTLVGTGSLLIAFGATATDIAEASNLDDQYRELTTAVSWELMQRSRETTVEPSVPAATAHAGAGRNSKSGNQSALLKFREALTDMIVETVPASARSAYKNGLRSRSKGDFRAAVKDYDVALRAAPNSLNLYQSKCDALLDQHLYKEALLVCDQAIKLSSGDGHFHLQRAYCNFQLKRYEEGIRDCSTAIERNPRNTLAFKERAKGYRKLGSIELANKDEERARQSSLPEQARQRMDNKEFDEALLAIDESLRLRPNHLYSQLLRARILAHLNRSGDAASLYTQMIQQIPRARDYICALRAPMYADIGQYDKAQADYEVLLKAAAKPPNGGANWLLRPANLSDYRLMFMSEDTEVLLKAGRCDQAIATASRLIEARHSPSDYALRAAVYTKCGAPQKALLDYSQALRDRPIWRILAARALLYEQLGKKNLAQKDKILATRLRKESLTAEEQQRQQAMLEMQMLRAQHGQPSLVGPD